jgi:serine/threonine protein kinase/WD40 repeat protein
VTDESVFADALAIDAAERPAYLDRACAGNPDLRREIEELLAAHDASNPLDRPPRGLACTGAYEPGAGRVTAAVGERVGPYKLLERIGEGGMGEVWAAEQLEPIKRRVAVKMIKPGMDSRSILARFEAERQALALMDHPNIAKVLDAGTTDDGRPYFVMELIKGTPITEFCDVRKLTAPERLKLFIPVCRAVQHAHTKGIIHRDIKPPNVLVALHDETPVPKVIDFGVNKAIGQQLTEKTLYTGFGALIGTLAYMAPEQAAFNQLDIDTRADVYALGVLLYELLAGSPPLEPERFQKAAIDEMLRLVREEEPPRPSQRLSTSQSKATIAATRQSSPAQLASLIRGELDWIVMKSLEKDRGRRYETAAGLARDLERYLRDEPVEACPPTLGYRVRKAVRKNKAAVITAVLFLAGALVAVAGQTWNLLRARAAEADAVAARNAEARQRDETARQRDAAVEAGEEADRKRTEAAVALGKIREAQNQQEADQYVWDMQILPLAVEANNVTEVNRLLDRHAPRPGQADRRGFEWFYWDRQFHSEVETGRLPDIGAPRGFWFAGPDGRRVARFVTPRMDTDDTEAPVLTVWDVTTRKVVLTHKMPIKKPRSPDYYLAGPKPPVFSPDGKRVVVECAFVPLPKPAPGNWVPAGNPFKTANPKHGNPVQIRQVLDVDSGAVLLEMKGNEFELWSSPRSPEAAFSPDGSRLAAVCQPPGNGAAPKGGPRQVRVWDLGSGKEVCAPLNADGLGHAPFGPGGTLLVTRKSQGTGIRASVWNLADGNERVGWDVPDRGISVLALSPSGTCVAAVTGRTPGVKGDDSPDEPQRVTIWSIETGNELHRMALPALATTGTASTRVFFSPDGSRLAIERTVTRAGKVRVGGDFTVWGVATGKALPSPRNTDTDPASAHRVIGATFSPDGKQLVNAEGNTLLTWDADTGKPAPALRGHVSPIVARAFSPDGKRLWSLEANGSIKEWDARPAGERAIRFERTREIAEASKLDVSSDGGRLASILETRTESDPPFTLRCRVQVWNAAGESLGIFTPPPRVGTPESRIPEQVEGLKLSRDGRRVALTRRYSPGGFGNKSDPGQPSSDLTVWDVDAKRLLLHQTLVGRQEPHAAISPDGRIVAVATDRTNARKPTIRLFDLDGARERAAITVDAIRLRGISFSPDGHRIAGLCTKGNAAPQKPSEILLVWEAESGVQLCAVEANVEATNQENVLDPRIAWAPDSTRFAFATVRQGESAIEVYDTTGKCLKTLDRPHATEPGLFGPPHLAWSPDNKRIAALVSPLSANAAPVVKVWDSDSGKEVLTLRPTVQGNVRMPKSLIFSEGGRRLLFTELVDLRQDQANGGFTQVRTLLTTTWDASPVPERGAKQP